MERIIKCLFCNNIINPTLLNQKDIFEYNCNCCKKVLVTLEAARLIPGNFPDGYKISYYLRNRFENNATLTVITQESLKEIIKDFPNRPLYFKIDKFLLYLAKKSDSVGKIFEINFLYDYSIVGCKSSEELIFILKHMKANGLLDYLQFITNEMCSLILSISAWNRIDEIEKRKIESNQGFVAMWFDKSMDTIYTNAIKPAIKDSEFEPFRIDSKEHNNKICDEIIIEIRRSKFLVADVTQLRGGIYFEAGYALGLGLPVIWTCREDKINDVHFDTRQYNHIVWKDEKDLYEQLKKRIQATIFVT